MTEVLPSETLPGQRRSPDAAILICTGGIALLPITLLPTAEREAFAATGDEFAGSAPGDVQLPRMRTTTENEPDDTTEDPAKEDTDDETAQQTLEVFGAPSSEDDEIWLLVARAKEGDKDAYAQIYTRYLDTVFRFVYFRVGNRTQAEDLTAETFVRALKRIGTVTWQGRDLGAWLVTIARNLVADHFKSGRYRLEVPTGDVLDADKEDHGPRGRPEMAVLDHITNIALLTAVRRLNPEQQECIVLRFLKGYSVAETAIEMGKNDGAIKALQYRAVRTLFRLLPEDFVP